MFELFNKQLLTKSLGDYNKERSSTENVKNIKWTQKNTTENKKPIKQNKRKIPSTNILNSEKIGKKQPIKKIFKIDEQTKELKIKNNILDKKSKKSSASNCKIKPSFRRPGR